ncbi:MAG: cytochrome bc complex cytochrome b subunit [Ardenticatenales bacterium]|jgi:quinol-cytochrome oxidoreductase complex cytochrome b subunit|nr:cytochrome bc complex cytochrome b subunit [Ardenticatenales bacterium]
MLGSNTLRNLRSNVAGEWQRIRDYDWRKWAAGVGDYCVRGIMAGLSAKELRAILRGDVPTERPNPRYRAQVKSFMLHLRPKYYQRGSTWFTHTWRLGWFATYFFVVETITGLILMLFYAPTPERAYGDMLYILSNVPYGKFMRDMHRLGAEGMVAVVILHMVRVYFTGSYKKERAFTWFTGVVLLLVTLVLSFSGYLLPWDQLAYWAVTIGTSMADAAPGFGKQVNLLLRGAVDIWAGGLLRFYLLHIFLLPLVAIVVISIHYYKVSREHSISLPAVVEEGDMSPEEKRYNEERIDLIPNLIIHELMLTSVATFLMVAAVATFFSAPLEQHADQAITPLHTEAPWYFLWLQGMLKLGSKQLFGIVLPTLMFALLFVVPWIDRNPHRMAKRRPVAIGIGVMLSVIMLVLTYMGTPSYGIETPPAQDILSVFVPQTHPGPLRELPWDELHTAQTPADAADTRLKRTYYVSFPVGMDQDETYADRDKYVFINSLDTSDPAFLTGLPPDLAAEPDSEFLHLLVSLKAKVEEQAKLLQRADGTPKAVVTVEYIQPELKWVSASIYWDEMELDREKDLTYMIPFTDYELMPDGSVKMDAAGKPVQLEPAKSKKVVYDLEYGAEASDGTRPILADPRPHIKDADGNAIYFDADGTLEVTDAQGEKSTINLADAMPNIKPSKQEEYLAIHRDSQYHH